MTTVDKRSKKSSDVPYDLPLDLQNSLGHENPPSPFSSIWKVFCSTPFLHEKDSTGESKALTRQIIDFCVSKKLPFVCLDSKIWLLPSSPLACTTYLILANDLSSEDSKVLDDLILKLSSLLPHMKSHRENN